MLVAAYRAEQVLRVVSRSQTAFSSFVFGREEKLFSSSRPNIKEEKAMWPHDTSARE